MRTRLLKLTATAGATALLAGVGALASAGSASAATTAAPAAQARSAAVSNHYYGEECGWHWTWNGWVWCCDSDWYEGGWWGGGLININIG